MRQAGGIGMWIGDPGRLLLSAALAMALASCASRDLPEVESGAQPAAAWWYDFELDPGDFQVHGIPVSEFDPNWTAATVLDDEKLGRRVPGGALETFQDSGLRLVVTEDLDLDGVGEEAFVGTYQLADGTRGRFLAVSREGRLIRHFEQAGSAGFSALLPVGDGVRWYKCLECGEFELLRWSGGAYVLE